VRCHRSRRQGWRPRRRSLRNSVRWAAGGESSDHRAGVAGGAARAPLRRGWGCCDAGGRGPSGVEVRVPRSAGRREPAPFVRDRHRIETICLRRGENDRLVRLPSHRR
jgi:hypothetical protein